MGSCDWTTKATATSLAMAAPNLLESLANVLEDATLKLNLTLNLEEMWQATVVYSEKNPKRFLCLVFMFIYLVFNNWPALLVVTFLFLCLVYQEMEAEMLCKATEELSDWLSPFLVVSLTFNVIGLMALVFFLYQRRTDAGDEEDE